MTDTAVTPEDVLIVGASAGGLGVAEGLRRQGYAGSIRLVGAEPHLPYDRPPLSKQVLAGAWPPGKAELRERSELDDVGLEMMLGRRATALSPHSRRVTLDNGESLSYGAVVIATGLAAHNAPSWGQLSGVHTLRTLDDALALRADLVRARSVAVIGAGVLGCELAATARGIGADVTLIDPQPRPMAGQLPQTIATAVADLHRAHGVRLRLGNGVDSVLDDGGGVSGVRLTGGETLDADLVIVATGSRPNTAWLHSSGLSLTDGVDCDAYCRAGPDIYAVGDVARWHHAGMGVPLRLENRTNVTQQARVVAANILGDQRTYEPTPFFWTDQYDVKLQAHGLLRPDAQVAFIEGTPSENKFVALAGSHGRVTGVIGWNHPRQARLHRHHVIDGTAWENISQDMAGAQQARL